MAGNRCGIRGRDSIGLDFRGLAGLLPDGSRPAGCSPVRPAVLGLGGRVGRGALWKQGAGMVQGLWSEVGMWKRGWPRH